MHEMISELGGSTTTMEKANEWLSSIQKKGHQSHREIKSQAADRKTSYYLKPIPVRRDSEAFKPQYQYSHYYFYEEELLRI